MNRVFRIAILATFGVLTIICSIALFDLKFTFDFEQFFPTGDPDLEFFRTFSKDFESDDNFLLIGIHREEGVFEQDFLEKFHDLTIKTKGLPHVVESQSLTKISYPLKTPFGITSIPVIHINDPSKYEADKNRILSDERFVYNLISKDATTLVIAIKVVERINLEQSRALIKALQELIDPYKFESYHFLGRPYFQKELVAMQQREVTISSLVSGLLVTLVMVWVFKRPWGIAIALFSIVLSMILFFGLLSIMGREMNLMAALYPVLMVIVGTSGVIHVMTKYSDELLKGLSPKDAIRVTFIETGLANFLTAATSAVGFGSLLSSRLTPIRDFGINSAIGVMVAFVTVVGFTTVALSFFKKEQIISSKEPKYFWQKMMQWFFDFTKNYPRPVVYGALVILAICLVGISNITTNYNISSNMPRGEKITEDFLYFQKELTSFRPMEFAVLAQNDYKVSDYEVLREIAKVEQHLKSYDELRGVMSNTVIYKTINQMYNSNRLDAYRFPPDETTFNRYQRLANQLPQMTNFVLESKDGKKARITSRVNDIGADSVKYLGISIDQWIKDNTNPNVVKFVRTGTALIIDKNAEYVRRNLLMGLGGAIVVIGILMGGLFWSWRMLVISMIPNIFPLFIAGALLGFTGIELEAGVSIVFSVIYGIAVDDTIHFLSKFRLVRAKGYNVEDALHVTFLESGKAIGLTTVILFFGFLVMLFSIHPPSVIIGTLISVTLFSAYFSDLFLLPILIRWLIKDK